jgi:hypothetical protein
MYIDTRYFTQIVIFLKKTIEIRYSGKMLRNFFIFSRNSWSERTAWKLMEEGRKGRERRGGYKGDTAQCT